MISGEKHLQWLRARRSIRVFSDRPIDRACLNRLVEAASTAPSSTNRQPWRFAILTDAALKARIVGAVRERTEQMKAIIRRGPHGAEFETYGDFFFEPLESASAVIVPQYREYPDAIAHLIESGGGAPSQFHTAAQMHAELCSASAAVMAMLLQAEAEELGACWMAGPMVARDAIQLLLGIVEPWRMLGAIALGYPAGARPAPTQRRPIEKIATWFER